MKRVNGVKLRIGESENTLISRVAKMERVNVNNIKLIAKNIFFKCFFIILDLSV